MSQKRFLTAAEVFQLFGVDADGLDRLIEAGDVTALPDMGTFKYRREDFAKLVKEGKLVPRTSGELFQADAKGEIPFLKIQNEDQALKFGEKIDFLELDEAALEEQARLDKPVLRTPVVPDKWFDDSEDSLEIPEAFSLSSQEIPSVADVDVADDATDIELNVPPTGRLFAESDSDVRIFDVDADIDLDSPGEMPSGSDSDVRLVGPVSSSGAGQLRSGKKPAGDSEIRLTKPPQIVPQSDSDVTLLTNVIEPSAHFGAPTSPPVPPGKKKPETDSDVQLSKPSSSASPRPAAPKPTEDLADSDSDVILVGLPTDVPPLTPIKPAKKADSDSDVRLASPSVSPGEEKTENPSDIFAFDSEQTHHELDFGDSNIRLEPVGDDTGSPSPILAAERIEEASEPDIEIEVEGSESDIVVEAEEDAGIVLEEGVHVDEREARLRDLLHDDELESDETIDLPPQPESVWLDQSEDLTGAKTVDGPTTDSDIMIEVEGLEDGIEVEDGDSGVSLDKTEMDIGIHAPTGPNDSDITLEIATTDDGSPLESFADGSGINLEQSAVEGGITSLDTGANSDITMEIASSGEIPVLEAFEEGSGISLEKTVVDGSLSSPTLGNNSDITLQIDTSGEVPVLAEFDEGSGITLEKTFVDGGLGSSGAGSNSDITLEIDSSGEVPVLAELDEDSGIRVEPEPGDSGIQLEETDSGVRFESQGDSEIALGSNDSGITLDGTDSGISLEQGDSGISLTPTDSGISLADGDSGISLTAEDSGISLDADEETFQTFSSDSDVAKQTELFDSSPDSVDDSTFNVSLAEDGQTMELESEDSAYDLSDAAATIAEQEPKQKKGKKQLALSEAFQLDEPPQVEDLDISDDLDAAGEDYTEEFAEAEEDAVEISDEAFSAEGLLADDEEEVEPEKSVAPITQKRTVPSGPSWDFVDVGLVTCASVAMALTVTVLLSGITTMWTGSEITGIAGMILPNLAGLSPW
jgi:hypothetical protein